VRLDCADNRDSTEHKKDRAENRVIHNPGNPWRGGGGAAYQHPRQLIEQMHQQKTLLLAGIAALLMATSAAHARPSKTQSWKLVLGTWCVGDNPSDNEAYVGIRKDKCGENEETLIIGENGYSWEYEDRLRCQYSSGRARFDNTIAASTKTVGVWVFHIIAGCMRPAEGAIKKYTQSFDMYVSKGTLWIEKLRSDKKP